MMSRWPQKLLIYEINTCVWLHSLSRQQGQAVTLGSVPQQEWDRLSSLGVDAVWLMGVWQRSPVGTRLAKANPDLQAEFRRVLPDLQDDDNVGSPYCVRRYTADEQFGGSAGLAHARAELSRRGVRLLLDFVPNHVAPDHAWLSEHPEYFIRGTKDDLRERPTEFLRAGSDIMAHGRDPYFPPWPDVVQLNAFDPGLRRAVADVLTTIGRQCDGVRCDMAMLMINRIFEQTWGARAGPRPGTEYWMDIIQAVRATHPEMLFMAEAYWDLEWELQQQGFDYCYDKRLYDRLEHESAHSVRGHLCADLAYQEKLVRFIENHDEPRAAATFPPDKHRAAAVVATTLPGAVLLHDGQFTGRRTKLPVFLRRGPDEPDDAALAEFYRTLLRCLRSTTFRDGQWHLCESTGWPDNQSHDNLLTWCWQKGAQHMLIVVNFSAWPAQGHVRLPAEAIDAASLRYRDAFSGQLYERSADELRRAGLYVELPAWGFHVWQT